MFCLSRLFPVCYRGEMAPVWKFFFVMRGECRVYLPYFTRHTRCWNIWWWDGLFAKFSAKTPFRLNDTTSCAAYADVVILCFFCPCTNAPTPSTYKSSRRDQWNEFKITFNTHLVFKCAFSKTPTLELARVSHNRNSIWTECPSSLRCTVSHPSVFFTLLTATKDPNEPLPAKQLHQKLDLPNTDTIPFFFFSVRLTEFEYQSSVSQRQITAWNRIFWMESSRLWMWIKKTPHCLISVHWYQCQKAVSSGPKNSLHHLRCVIAFFHYVAAWYWCYDDVIYVKFGHVHAGYFLSSLKISQMGDVTWIVHWNRSP